MLDQLGKFLLSFKRMIIFQGNHVTSLTFEELKPYRNYSLEVRGQPMLTSHPNIWSSWLRMTATTTASNPLAPTSSFLAFAVSDAGDEDQVTFHWKKQPVENEHGPGFSYLVNNDQNVTMPYSVQKVKKGKGVTIEVAGLNSVGRSHEVLRMRYLPSKKGNSDLDIGPSVVVTTNEDDTMVFWGKAGGAVVERQVIWGAGSSSQLLEQGIDWADAGTGAGNFTFPKNSTVPPQHVFLAAADADGASPGVKIVKCRLTARPIFNVSLDQGNVTTNSISLRIGLGLCRDQEDEQLLLQRTTLTWCNSKDNCEDPSNHHSTSSESKGASLTLTNLPNSTCICIISLEVETVLGSATTNFSSSCSFCTGKAYFDCI